MAIDLDKIKEQIKELGFGTKGFINSGRLINKDGTFNVIKKGGGLGSFSLYHWLINMNWLTFFGFITVSYLIINLIFASFYYLAGADQLSGYDPDGIMNGFLHCFYFSTQTLTTVGFGKISPLDHLSHIISSFEAMIGLLSFALATGILYGRFSKAKSKILFSKNAIIGPYRGIKGFKFRIANLRKNQVIDLKASIMYSFLIENGDDMKRIFHQLDLEIEFINLFPIPWTIVHPIDEESPLLNKGAVDFAKEKAEFLIILKGYDDTFGQEVHQVHSYKYDELIFDAQFEMMFHAEPAGTTVFLNKINDFRKTY